MAQAEDPIVNIIGDGRIRTRPILHYGLPDVITVDLDQLAANITRNAVAVYVNCARIRARYSGSANNITTTITSDVTMMINFAIAQTYNRLRSILDRRAPDVRSARMNPRAPVSNTQEFPTWISATLGAIGHIRVIDGTCDHSVVFASTTATMNHYGRNAAIAFNEGLYCRITEVLRECNFTFAPLPQPTAEGSFFPTCTIAPEGDTYRVLGSLHSSHYENEDIIRISFCTDANGSIPFEDVGVTLGYVDDETTLTALAAVAAPAGIPEGQVATSAGRPVGINYRVNYYGIQPAVAAQGATPARNRGCYILGRGVDRIYQCVLADQLSTVEIYDCIRFRLLR